MNYLYINIYLIFLNIYNFIKIIFFSRLLFILNYIFINYLKWGLGIGDVKLEK